VEQVVLLALLIFAAAILYSSVGHAGASGYLAVMALVGVAPDVMKPTALALNILVPLSPVRGITGPVTSAGRRCGRSPSVRSRCRSWAAPSPSPATSTNPL
jgi:hypothetical protein